MKKLTQNNSILRIDEITALFYKYHLSGDNQQAHIIAQQCKQQMPSHVMTKIITAIAYDKILENLYNKTEQSAQKTINILIDAQLSQKEKHIFGQVLLQLYLKGENAFVQHLYEKCPDNIKKNNPYVMQYQAKQHMDKWEHKESLSILEKIPPNHRNAEICEQMALCARIMGNRKKMDEYFAQSIEHEPKNYDIMSRWGLAKIYMGDMKKGWRIYEARKKTNYPDFHIPSQKPAWNGRPFPGETLLLYQELGYGDVIQFARYFKQIYDAAQPNGKIIFACKKPIETLMKHAFSWCFDKIILLEDGDPIEEHHIYASTYGLPAILDETLKKSIIKKPYLKVSPKKITSTKEKKTCGIVWYTSPKNAPNRIYKIIDPTYLAILKNVQNTHFFSLQFGREQNDLIKNDPKLNFIDTSLRPWDMDFLQLTQTIAGLDGIITIDTATAHIAGAMFKPVIVPIPYGYIADWRWQKINYIPSLYPTMTLIRHKKINDWENVLYKIVTTVNKNNFFCNTSIEK